MLVPVRKTVPDELAAEARPRPGPRPPDLDAGRAHLAEAGLARQTRPEDVRVVDDFDRTASGNIAKYVLREALGR